MEPERSLPRLKQPATSPYREHKDRSRTEEHVTVS